MNHDKRRKRQERRRLRDAGISFRWLRGDEATPADWRFFVECYNRTYRAHHSTPYLNLEFFERLAQAMPANLMLVLAFRDGAPIASALNVFGSEAIRPLLAAREFTRPAPRGLLLPGHRVLHREPDSRLRRGCTGEHKLARGAAGAHRVGPLAAPGVRRRRRAVPAARSRGTKLGGRTRRPQPVRTRDRLTRIPAGLDTSGLIKFW
jgi:hypothetical protein